MGITTIEEYRQKGFATLVTAAAADYCIKEKKDLRWFCAAQNIPSWKTAEKVGFVRFKEYTVLCGDFI
jgi:RimJ/RimL family protein N-acetyltransferase